MPFEHTLSNQQFLAPQKAILIGLSEGFLAPFFVGLCNVNGDTDWYPHFNMTFPHSRQVVEHHLKGLSSEQHRRYTWDNAMDLFKLDLTEENRVN